ncbi:AAA family ATPase [Marinobacter sp. 1_MG-2023]|uniref:AAA family ATPase n=1 Tax=Marinobacter sp. 1_MG-2023 TaxID=3062627 RepID=UPI0026E315A6|nr:AAA family ATPase [Marinobacter sp. 1_MG-2023]MDO6825009.1 AAA family ATPase [Marinobacter sp. 1_MG-2023]
MKLQSLRVEQFRQFSKGLELGDLQPGINLIHGPNESGKSTLVRAIRAAFFERYRSKSAEDLAPWGDSSAAPTVEILFEHNGQRWQLDKRFLKRHRCDLLVDSTAFSGEEAEEKLAELLGYQFPKKGASKEEHWGIPGLLWVEQGTGQDIEKAVLHAGGHLKSALNNLVGEVASSGGDEVIQAVEQQRQELLTATGKPRGDYLALANTRETLQQEVGDLQERIDQYKVQVDRLGILANEHEQASRDRPWEEARRGMQRAEVKYREVEALQEQQTRGMDTLKQLQQNLTLLQQSQAHWRSQNEQLELRHQSYQKATKQLEQEELASPELVKAVESARKHYHIASEAVQHAHLRDKRQRLQKECAKLETELAKLKQNQEQANSIQASLDGARKQKKKNLIDVNVLRQLKQNQRELDDTNIRIQTVATRVTWHLDSGKELTLDGQNIAGQGEKLLLEPGVLEIPGLGSLGIQPGGEDLESLRRQQERLKQSVSQQLSAMSVDSVEAAEMKQGRLQEAEAQIQRFDDLLKSLAPQGVEQLNSAKAEVESELLTRTAELEALPAAAAIESDDKPLSLVESQLKQAEERLTDAEARQRNQEAQLLKARYVSETACREWQRMQEELNSPERQKQMDELNRDIAAAEKQKAELESSLKERDAQIREARPELLKQDIERYRATAEHQEKAQQNRALELSEIRARLEAWGAEGLEEQHNEQAAELEHVNRRYLELDRRAKALDLLLNLLKDKRQALTRRLQAPLQKHLDHYLSVLFPEASLEVDENLMPGKFSRGSELGQMAELSYGAREQMGLISRLAYADLLQEAGRPTLIILDDTLVHSDAERLDGMKRILFDAATRHQILLFTCHPEKWRDLGVEPRDLEALKLQGQAG